MSLPAVGMPSDELFDINLVRQGKSGYVIVIPKQPTSCEKLGAEEIVRYVELISGARLPIQEGGDLPAKAIVIAETSHLGGWITDNPNIKGDEYALLVRDSRLFLTGGRGRSTLYAAYNLLSRLGCRWLAPNFSHYQGAGEYIPKKRTLTCNLPAETIEKSTFAIRKLDIAEGVSHTTENLKQMIEWMSKSRFNTLVIPYDQHGAGRAKWENWREQIMPVLQERDMIIEVGGHGYPNFIGPDMEGGKLFAIHPEWFGQDENGVRNRGDWDGKGRRVFCTSNQDAVQYLIANFLKYAVAHPEIQVFDFWPPDGAVWCECDRCKALGDPSERQFLLLNQVMAAVKQVRPDLRLECIAYHRCIMPPKTVNVNRNILVDFCPDGQCFEVQINDPSAPTNAYYMTALNPWRKMFRGDINIYTYYRKYMWRSLPVIIAHYMQKDLQFYRSLPVQGIQCYAEPGDWFTYELNHYVLGKLDWDPSVDVDAIIRDFCRTRYGRASKEAVFVYNTLEDVVRRTCDIPLTSLKTTDELEKAQKVLINASSRLEHARNKIADPAAKRNIGRLLLTVEYAVRDLDVQKCRAAKSPEETIRKQESDLTAFLSAHTGEGIFLP